MRLKDKVALITGSGRGIGRAAAKLFAKEGSKVVVSDIDEEKGKETVKIIKEAGGEAVFVKGDVTKEDDAKMMVKTAVDKYGRIDVLYNNAGILGSSKMLVDEDEKDWDRMIDVSLKGTFLCSKYALREMMKQGGGSIINVSSSFGIRGIPGSSAYSAAKAAVAGLTRVMAVEYAAYNIRVNAIHPGAIQTRMTIMFLEEEAKSRGLKDVDEIRRRWLKTIPLGRTGEPEEIAKVALFLASDESSYITGSSLIADGGATATFPHTHILE